MNVNTDIWGAAEDWRDLSGFTYAYRAEFKRPKSGVNSYSDLYVSEVLQGGVVPTDLSISFWGINKKSILAHPVYLASYWDNDEIKTSVNRVSENATTVPCILNYTGNSPSIDVRTNWNGRYAPSDNPGESAWSKNNTTVVPGFTREIAISFNYQKVLLVPWVKIALENPVSDWGYQIVLLKDYIDGRTTTYANYDKIVGIGYRMAVGDTNRSENNTGIGFVIPTNYEGSEREYISGNTYKWYATQYGYYTLSTNGVIGNSNTRSITPYNDNQTGTTPIDFSSMHLIGDADTGFRYKYCTNYSSTYGQVPIYYYDTDEPLWKVNAYTPWNTNYAHPFPYIECTAENVNTVRDYVLTQIAYLGFPFVYDNSKARYGQIGDEGVYLPKFDESGVTTGEYAEGAAALILPNAEWVDGRTGSGYDPYAPPPSPDQEDFGYLINPFNSNRFTTGLNVWCMYQQDILDVLAGINNLYLTDPTGNEKWQLDFKGSNPDDYIVSCKAMLLDVAHSDTTSAFKLGPVQFDGIACYKYSGTGSFSFGTIPLDGTGDYTPYGDFRDYQPYTSMELYIPLCGTVEIDPEFFVGHNIEIIMMYDIYTGACTAGIYRDNFTLWKAVNGQIGADIPVSAMQMGTYQNAIHSLQAAQKQNEIRLASSAVTVAAGAAALIAAPATGGTSLIAGAGLISGAAGLLSGVMQEQNYDYQIEHTQPIPAQTTAAETQNNFCVGGLYPILYVKRAKMLQGYNAEIYSHTIGNACLINDVIGSQSGLVMCSSVDLSGVPATVEEIIAIKQALGKGVYV